jgi:hypothetical protein
VERLHRVLPLVVGAIAGSEGVNLLPGSWWLGQVTMRPVGGTRGRRAGHHAKQIPARFLHRQSSTMQLTMPQIEKTKERLRVSDLAGTRAPAVA